MLLRIETPPKKSDCWRLRSVICLSFDCYLFCPLPVPGGVYLSGTGVCAAAVAACSVRFIFTASFISGFILSPAVCGSRNIKRREQQQIGEASQTVQCRLGWYTCFHSFFFLFFFWIRVTCVFGLLLLACGCFGCGPMKSRKHWLGFSLPYIHI